MVQAATPPVSSPLRPPLPARRYRCAGPVRVIPEAAQAPTTLTASLGLSTINIVHAKDAPKYFEQPERLSPDRRGLPPR